MSRIVGKASRPARRIAACLLAALLGGLAPEQGRASVEVLEGYVAPLSAAPGDTLLLMVSSTVPWRLAFARYRLAGGQNVAIRLTKLVDEPGGVQPAPDSAWLGCGWSASERFVIPPDWTSGLYAAECAAPGLSTRRIPFVVRPPPGAHAPIAVLANTNTWNAYNAWGGRSKYTDPPAHYLSSLRPNLVADPVIGSAHLARGELWVHDFLATSGYRVDVYSDWDFHQGIPDLDDYKALVISTHPEYWSRTMLDRLESYLAHGGCLVDLGGNAIFETVRFSPEGTLLTMFPEWYCGSSGCRRNSYFRNLVPPRPERAILGVAYRSDAFGTYAPFRVLKAVHRFFAGTGVANGDTIGAGGLIGAASGWEMDTSLPGLAPDGFIVSARGSDDRGVSPANLELLARGTNAAGCGADMTWYATPAGGGVFAAGSISFGGSLAVDSTLQRIVRNVLDECLSRPPLATGPPPEASAASARSAAAPNPFARTTRLAFALERPGAVRLCIFDLAGRQVRVLLEEPARPAGPLEATWDGRDDQGRHVPDGVYFARFEVGVQAESRRIVRLR